MSKSINRVILLGNLTKEVEARYTTGGKAVATVSLATNERTKKDGQWVDVPNYHTIVLWDKLAEVAQNYLKKGSRCLVEGRIVTRTYEKDGTKKWVTEIIANDLVLIDKADKTPAEPAAQSDASEESPF